VVVFHFDLFGKTPEYLRKISPQIECAFSYPFRVLLKKFIEDVFSVGSADMNIEQIISLAVK